MSKEGGSRNPEALRRLLLPLVILTACTKTPSPPPRPFDVVPAPNSTLTRAQALADPEGYSLRMDLGGQLTVEAKTDAGRFYAAQTLKQLNHKGGQLELNDAPRFRWRALHFDVARHFFPVTDIEHLLDLMARLKLNTFHWHLTDDQGWRLPIAGHPELTSKGPAYSRADIARVVAYARDLHITVVPEVDLPGHTRALLASHPELSCRGVPLDVPTTWGVFDDVLCVGNPATYVLVDEILTDIAAQFPGPFLHLGGDEVRTKRWDECPKCQALNTDVQTHFLAHVAAKVRSLGKRPVGWDEVLEHQAPSDLVVMAWRNLDAAKHSIDAGHDTVVVPYQLMYLDREQSPYDDDPVRVEDIAAFEPPDSPRVLGVEGTLWTEFVTDIQRAEQQLFPRLFAVADVAWSSSAARKANPLDKRLRHARNQLDTLGVSSFVDPPLGLEPRKAFLDGGIITLTALGSDVFYELDGTSDVTRQSRKYEKPLFIGSTTEISARAFMLGQKSPIIRGRVFVEPPMPALDAGFPQTFDYYEQRFTTLPDFDALTPVRSGLSDGGSLIPDDVREYDWALRTVRAYDAAKTGIHRFTVSSDDGARLFVDGRLVVENDGLHAVRPRSGEIALERGTHRLLLEYFQRGGRYALMLDAGVLP